MSADSCPWKYSVGSENRLWNWELNKIGNENVFTVVYTAARYLEESPYVKTYAYPGGLEISSTNMNQL